MLSWNGRSGTIFLQTTHLQPHERINGEYKEAGKGRTQEGQAHGAQESQDRQTAEAARLSARKQEAENQEVGSRHFEALKITPPRWCSNIAAQRGGDSFGVVGLAGFVVTHPFRPEGALLWATNFLPV